MKLSESRPGRIGAWVIISDELVQALAAESNQVPVLQQFTMVTVFKIPSDQRVKATVDIRSPPSDLSQLGATPSICKTLPPSCPCPSIGTTAYDQILAGEPSRHPEA